MDVAISGSTPRVERGTITLLAGGDAGIFKAAEPIFKAIAQQYFLMGPSRSGTSIKLVTNTIVGIGREAIALGEAEDLSRKDLLNVLSRMSIVTPAQVGKLARTERGDYSSEFPVALMNAGYRLILEAADSSDLALPAIAAASKVNSAAWKQDSAADFFCMIRHMERSVELTVSGK